MNRRPMARSLTILVVLAILLAGCGAFSSPTPAAVPTIVLDQGGAASTDRATDGEEADAAPSLKAPSPAGGAGRVTASGVIVPGEEARLAFSVGGAVQAVDGVVGERVEAGQVLVRLAGSDRLNAAVSAANLEKLSAEQALADLKENAGQARAQAMLRLATAKDAFDQAEKRRGWKEYRVGDDNQVAVAQADLILAEDNLRKIEEVYGGFAESPDDNLNKAAALSALAAARKARDKALANLNYLLSLPDALAVEKADAELEVARTELETAQREYERLKDGPDPHELALAEARVENARIQRTASQSALADLELKAPFSGVLARVEIHSGEWVTPGQPVLILADLDHLRVETTDLSERDIPNVAIGQPVAILVEALNQWVAGSVIEIAPLADTLGGDVVYKTSIQLGDTPAGLRPGMSVEVLFEE